MNLASVRLFLEVLEAGSISRVAARRHTVQSHVSRQVSEFEQSIGGALFLRTGRGVRLSELGQRAAPRLRAWVQETERLSDELHGESGRVSGEVRLGIIPSAAHPLVTRLFQRLQQSHPGVRLNVTEAQGIELNALLDSGAVDLAVLFRYSRPSGLDEALLSIAHTYLVSAPGDPLTERETVNFTRLRDLRLVLPRRPSHWRDALDEAARSLGFKLTPVAEADSLSVQKQLVIHDPSLYSILGPYSIAEELAGGLLRASRLIKPDLVRHVTLSLPKFGKRSRADRVVATMIEDLVRSWGHQLTEPSRQDADARPSISKRRSATSRRPRSPADR